MIVIVDASAAVKLLIDDPGSEIVRRLWDEPVTWLAPTTLVPEVSSAITSACEAGRHRGVAMDDVQALWQALADEIDLHVVDVELALEAGRLAHDHGIPDADAVAIALARAMHPFGDVVLLSFDGPQRGAAVEAGIDVVPAGRGPGPATPHPVLNSA